MNCWYLGKVTNCVLPQETAIVGTSLLIVDETATNKEQSTKIEYLDIVTKIITSSIYKTITIIDTLLGKNLELHIFIMLK